MFFGVEKYANFWNYFLRSAIPSGGSSEVKLVGQLVAGFGKH
jgi:hypothetical protein